jgi:hypothetical protein
MIDLCDCPKIRIGSNMETPNIIAYEPETTTTTSTNTTTTLKGVWISENQIKAVKSLRAHDTLNDAYIRGYDNCRKDVIGTLHI